MSFVGSYHSFKLLYTNQKNLNHNYYYLGYFILVVFIAIFIILGLQYTIIILTNDPNNLLSKIILLVYINNININIIIIILLIKKVPRGLQGWSYQHLCPGNCYQCRQNYGISENYIINYPGFFSTENILDLLILKLDLLHLPKFIPFYYLVSLFKNLQAESFH